MRTNFFDQEGDTFRDIPDEVGGEPAEPVQSAPRARPAQPQPEIQEEFLEEVIESVSNAEEDEEDYSAVLSDARLRLEQGRLYEMIMNHDLFAGLDADQAAIKHVQKQIRKFAKEQMEIMLGMRRETAKVERLEIDFPFNQVEVNVLKMLAKTASKGASENSDNYVPEVKKITEEIPVVGRKEGLNQISVKPRQTTPKKIEEKKLPAQPAKPIQRKKTTLTETQQQILAESGVSQRELDATFDPNYKPLEKPLSEMTAEELAERNKRISTRRAKATGALPMPSPDQEASFHQMRVLDESVAMSPMAVTNILNALNKNQK